MFEWNEKNIKWFSSSANNTNFHKIIAQEIIPYLSKDSSLLSLGSGLGYLERELSKYVKSMVLIDKNEFAVNFLNEHKEINQKIIKSNWEKYNEKSDFLLLSFFSRMFINDSLEKFLNLVNNKIFYIVNERHSKKEDVIQYFENKEIDFTYKEMVLDFDQVLKKNEINDYLEQYYSQASEIKRDKLIKQFEYIDEESVIFKNKKKIIMFVISKGDNR